MQYGTRRTVRAGTVADPHSLRLDALDLRSILFKIETLGAHPLLKIEPFSPGETGFPTSSYAIHIVTLK